MTVRENVRCKGDLDDNIHVLAVVPPREGAELVRILSHTRWEVYTVNSIADAVQAMRRFQISVILCEHSLPDGTWLDLLERAGELAPTPQLLVLSETPDDRLWAEVLNCGGYDLLTQPLEAREVYQAIAAAWRHGKALARNPKGCFSQHEGVSQPSERLLPWQAGSGHEAFQPKNYTLTTGHGAPRRMA